MKNAAAIGIIGIPDEKDIEELERQFGEPVKRIERRDKIILLIGKGLFKKKLVIPK